MQGLRGRVTLIWGGEHVLNLKMGTDRLGDALGRWDPLLVSSQGCLRGALGFPEQLCGREQGFVVELRGIQKG